jgi:hypothetical protein
MHPEIRPQLTRVFRKLEAREQPPCRRLVLDQTPDQDRNVFDVGDRDRVRDRVLEIASSDPRVVGGAVLGSLAHDEGDQWSDLDLMFSVGDPKGHDSEGQDGRLADEGPDRLPERP